MSSLLALSGLRLDRPFPELGVDAAERRRSIAMTLLLGAIGQARDLGADALVFVGGLFDERCISPRSVTALVQILDAYPGHVLIAPGEDTEGIYAATNWGPRTAVWSSREFAKAPEPLGAVQGRAGKRGGVETLPEPPDAWATTVLVEPGLGIDTCAEWVAGDRARYVLTSGAGYEACDGVTVLGSANPDLGEPWGEGVFLTYDDSMVISIERIKLTTLPPAETVSIVVSELATTPELLDTLDKAVAAVSEWSVIRLVGELPQGVQLPATAHYVSSRDDVAIRADEVSFGFAQPAEDDHTALAEFIRSLINADADPQDRHQAIAVGVEALVPSDGSDES